MQSAAVWLSVWHRVRSQSLWGFFSLYSGEGTHATGAERADFQGERRCCSGSWEPVSQSHTHMALAGDRGETQ